MVEYLVTKEEKLMNSRNILGETPVLMAILRCQHDLAEKLLAAGADINIPNRNENTALHFAVANPEIVHLLIKHGANVDARNCVGETPLHIAVRLGHFETVCMLLHHNADANSRDWKKGYTPFIRAIQSKNVEMQDALIDFVDDFDTVLVHRSERMTMLDLALEKDSPYVEEIINRAGDVNNANVCRSGMFVLFTQNLRFANLELGLKRFKLIWDNLDYRFPNRISKALANLSIVDEEFFKIALDYIIESDQFSHTVKSVSCQSIYMFTNRCANIGLPLNKLTNIFCTLLTYGYVPNGDDLSSIFSQYGYCELYRILLYMDIKINDDNELCDTNKYLTRAMYDVKCETSVLLEALIDDLNKDCSDSHDLIALDVLTFLDYSVNSKLIKTYQNLNKTDCVTLKMNSLPRVPSLLELARNKTRDCVIERFSVTNSCELHTLLDNLDIPDVCRKILRFEIPVYKPTYTAEEFVRFLGMLNKCRARKQILNPIIQSTLKNSILI